MMTTHESKAQAQQSWIDRLYWYTTEHNQGQIVECSEPQIPGAAEGSSGPADGLHLIYNHSDRSWFVRDDKLGEILSGKGEAPTVRQAMERRARLKTD